MCKWWTSIKARCAWKGRSTDCFPKAYKACEENAWRTSREMHGLPFAKHMAYEIGNIRQSRLLPGPTNQDNKEVWYSSLARLLPTQRQECLEQSLSNVKRNKKMRRSHLVGFTIVVIWDTIIHEKRSSEKHKKILKKCWSWINASDLMVTTNSDIWGIGTIWTI